MRSITVDHNPSSFAMAASYTLFQGSVAPHICRRRVADYRLRPSKSRTGVCARAKLADPSAGAALQEQIYAGVLQAKREQLLDKSRCEECWHLARDCLCSALKPTRLTGPEQDVQVGAGEGGYRFPHVRLWLT